MNRAKCSRAAGRTGHGENPDAQSLDCGGRKVDWAVVCTPAGRPLVPRHLHLRGRGVSETGVKRVEGARAGGGVGRGGVLASRLLRAGQPLARLASSASRRPARRALA